MNRALAEKILIAAGEAGVREFCVCAGARNSPLVMALDVAQGVQIYNFFDERSAAFFALGRIHATGFPVAVVTTSGTAVAELLPAAVEATYSNLPLLLITADRPREYRGTGAPQTIEQVGIFSHYVQSAVDIADESENLDLQNWQLQSPFHINACFKEPLIEGPSAAVDFSKLKIKVLKKILMSAMPIRNIEKPLVIVGGLKPDEQGPVVEFLKRLNAFVYAEAISGLRGHPDLQNLLLKGGEKTVQAVFYKKLCSSVLRLGGVPTLRFWRDLEEKYKDIPVFSASANDYTGLSRDVCHVVGLQNLGTFQATGESPDQSIRDLDQNTKEKIDLLIKKYPQSEVSLLEKMLSNIKPASVYVGNSLPIRELDIVSSTEKPMQRWLGNRGANGIDGQLSSFLGWAQPSGENWCFVGDLTALYDLSALWITKSLRPMKKRIVVVNNSGGQIFKNIFSKEIFLNRHEIHFQKWAEMWNWNYQKWQEIPDDLDMPEENVIIELIPSEVQSQDFWLNYQKI